MRFAVVTFPGSNGDHDALMAIRLGLGHAAELVWYTETDLSRFDCIIIPGGFSYGDYLRAGALARFAPVMSAVAREAEAGKPILGICNGFQILTEARLLPGALLRNASLEFVCDWVWVRVEQTRTPWTSQLAPGTLLRLPIAHGEGRYYVEAEELVALETNGQVVFRYVDADGLPTADANPNGSVANIAGVCNERGNVVGLMPHPERAYDRFVGGDDGLRILASVLSVGLEVAHSPR
ncbi:MAG: phosphoribosylformylglycinamidine synthase subunit PurQ [Thermomicrobium sp.]|jgi:phosphoribosylformylglycinamidine synthase|uniref:Phosphoribosylformylglycinamidine synthase subunit PurQ n=1 Tax=Thermomicrobium roseum (strain ATCC 27502 / DSM 5159 / P-2) TaxID=309801 RepID=PURQ_THERP|nr:MULTISPECIES: phosphoribosylformylglycinamidine synthase subunit PurQ [Thermomicrobium]B9KZ37.1 RecName: Full=Phosphoribosylformylglycinamidine synthase subunit PurQ; Short=FGAM synthase; AltName: Full=Formylglycinamide ribonucleotide amidotransferase subunit I; Short=FGAR amidotransferase I; Short=FGAR-AT I; AltName: Full=Glutaminase PurQ; AltName: Full=Phosphoribosylformylglycinamidine synthase subunit I [Thermomicrobium roseum DSM 5159]ACM05040.1 phosphoribosylformylglycinamidine synthase I